MAMQDLKALGWDATLAGSLVPWARQGYVAGRIAAEHTHVYRVFAADGELLAQVSGRLRYEAEGRDDFPATGDWVVLEPRPEEARATIHAILPRRSCFSRKVAGEGTEEQVVAANIDTVFLVVGLDGDFNLRRIERALVLARRSGAAPVVVLTKADLCDAVAARVREAEAVAPGVPVHAVSSLHGPSLEAFAPYLAPGKTVALLGSSGVGKSTLVNRLLGSDVLRTAEVRVSDSRGRHTTTHRQLIVLPGGGLVIDTPGLRELQLWTEGEGIDDAFDDIVALAGACGFRDCGHESEPGCAVRASVSDGRLAPERFENWRKLQRELRQLEIRQDERMQSDEKRRHRAVHKAMRNFKPRG